jgi:hypothetical protein
MSEVIPFPKRNKRNMTPLERALDNQREAVAEYEPWVPPGAGIDALGVPGSRPHPRIWTHPDSEDLD